MGAAICNYRSQTNPSSVYYRDMCIDDIEKEIIDLDGFSRYDKFYVVISMHVLVIYSMLPIFMKYYASKMV